MAYILSKHAELGYSTTGTAPISYTKLNDLVSIPALGEREQVETTTLDDEGRTYIDGLIGSELEFVFIYDDSSTTNQFETLQTLVGTDVYWKITFPGTNTLACTFTGKPRVNFNAFEVGSRVEYTLKISVTSTFAIA